MVPGRNVTFDRPTTVAEGEPLQRLSSLALTSLTTAALFFPIKEGFCDCSGSQDFTLRSQGQGSPLGQVTLAS